MYIGESGAGNRDDWYKYTYDNADPGDEGVLEGLGNDLRFVSAKLSYSFRNSVKEWMSEILAVLFEAAALCINTLRTFHLVVLSILGPLVFGLAVFDGFQHTLTVWLARYINIYLWLPVANIFGSIIGKIQENMLAIDISQVEDYGDTFFSATDVAYLVFMVIGIIGYFTVPSIANYIVHAGGGGGLTQKITSMLSSSSRTTIAAASTGAGMVADTMGNAASKISSSMSSSGTSSGYFNEGDKKDRPSGYMNDKLTGN